MDSAAFEKVLTSTGYLLPDGSAARGLARAGQDVDARLRALLSGSRIGLKADAVFSAQSVPTAIFKDAGNEAPSEAQLTQWHETAWNIGVAPLLWIITPTDVRLYDCYSSPTKLLSQEIATEPLEVFPLQSEDRLRALDAMCGRFATETGAFWSSAIGKRIDRRHRVDRELLEEISELEDRLTRLPPANGEPLHDENEEKRESRDFAQRLIGRCIFASYLVDRGIAQRFLPQGFPTEMAAMLGSVGSAFELFGWLRTNFNGDLFPMDDPGAEHQRLGDAHLDLLRDFVDGRSLLTGQGRLFRFRFDAIPVDLISSMYQQFARSTDASQSAEQGLHYTPVELVHLTLDPVFEGLHPAAKVIDPTCGSGAFLVEAFRRLVWKRTQGKPASRAVVRDVLYNQLYGIDINKSALGIAVFSLYLAALELDEEPVQAIEELKFDRLIGDTLFQADTLDDNLPTRLLERPFDAVVGNPPWTFVKKEGESRKRSAGEAQSTRPRRSPDQDFLWVASQLAGDAGRIGMIMKASPFFSKDIYAMESRKALLQALNPAALVNLSALRKEGLFPDATGPALLFFARCVLMDRKDQLLVGSIPWTPDFSRNGVFHIGPAELRTIPLSRVLKTPPMLKAATFGTVRDGWLIEKLERTFPTLGEVLDTAGITIRGQGFQVKGKDRNTPPREFYRMRVLTPGQYMPFRVDDETLPYFQYETLHRIRDRSIYKGPVLLCPEGGFLSTTGRYSATVSDMDLLYTESFFGVSFAGIGLDAALILSAILSSSLTTFQLAYGGGAWGLERTKVKPNDLLALRVPALIDFKRSELRGVFEAERNLAGSPDSKECLDALDRAVFQLYDLDRDEALLASESIERAKMLIFEGRERRLALTKRPSEHDLTAYAAEVVRTVNSYLRARGKRHLEAVVYLRPISAGRSVDSTPSVDVVRFTMIAGAPPDAPIVHQGSESELLRLASVFRGQVSSESPPYLNERRQLRIYDEDTLFVLKPSDRRYWTQAAGLNDGDAVLADHWIRGLHASVA